jgi:hypothetical protein
MGNYKVIMKRTMKQKKVTNKKTIFIDFPIFFIFLTS